MQALLSGAYAGVMFVFVAFFVPPWVRFRLIRSCPLGGNCALLCWPPCGVLAPCATFAYKGAYLGEAAADALPARVRFGSSRAACGGDGREYRRADLATHPRASVRSCFCRPPRIDGGHLHFEHGLKVSRRRARKLFLLARAAAQAFALRRMRDFQHG